VQRSQRTVTENLDKVFDEATTQISYFPIGRYRCCNADDIVLVEKIGNKSDSTYVDVPIAFGKPQPLGKVDANNVAVEKLNLEASALELHLNVVGVGALARP
jgi:hypothetical protein